MNDIGFLIQSLVDIVKKKNNSTVKMQNNVLNLYVVQLISQMLEDKR